MVYQNKWVVVLLIVLSAVFFPYQRARAKAVDTSFAFNLLTINDGLSQGMVNCILQDRYGFMWFATKDGLNRYDGYGFTVYQHDAKDPASITENHIETLFEDSKGRLWIGTPFGGLDLFDRESETFLHIKHEEGNRASLSEGIIKKIAEDKNGDIWVQFPDKLDKITIHEKGKEGKGFSVQHMKLPALSAMFSLTITQSGKIYYVNAREGLVYRLQDETKQQWSPAFDVSRYLQQQNIKATAGSIYCLVEDKAQQKFYVMHSGGITLFDEKTGRPEKLFRTDFKNTARLFHATLDKRGTIWFLGLDKLALFDTRTGQLRYAEAKDSSLNQLLIYKNSIFCDRSGIIWIGTGGYGILKRNLRSELFHHTGRFYVHSIKALNNGHVMISHNMLTHKVFDKAKGRFTDPIAAEQVQTYTENFTDLSFPSLASDTPYLWFADSTRLLRFDRRLKRSTAYPLPVKLKNGYYELVQAIVKDGKENIWLGTMEGLLRLCIADGSWTLYRHQPKDSGSLRSNSIYSLCIDPLQPQKYLWIGTRGSGLSRMDMETGMFVSYSVKDGLPNNVIYGILPDDDGNLWMSTNKGLSCFNTLKKTFRNFDYKDGLQSNEFNVRAYSRTSDGWLFFGGVNGFNYFYPREILNNPSVPQIVITDIRIRNQSLLINKETSLLSEAPYLTRQLTLPYQQNFISFGFASMDFTDPQKNEYQYRLEGFDNDWIHSGTVHQATYTNLDPGTYTFKVKGSNSDGTWNESGTSLQLTILPPWYMTWWARSALAMVVLSAAYSFYRYRLAQALKLQAVRNRIAGDLHDEVGSNLSNIFIFSNVAQQRLKVADETAPLLQKITDYTQQSMEAMNDIVWMINTRNDRFENIMIRMRTLAAELSEATGCTLHLDFDEKLNDVKLNMEDRKNFYLIYKEALNNTAKYAGCKSVWIDLALHGNHITLIVRDNGKGFDATNKGKGNGLFNMKKRAELLNGTLRVESKVGEGTTIRLHFKV